MPELRNPREERFAQEYLIDLFPGRAAIRAGYSANGASPTGYALLAKQRIADRISELKAERYKRSAASAERVIRELSRIAFASARDAVSWSPAGIVTIPSDELTEDVAAAVCEVSEVTQGRQTFVKVKMHDKLPALRLLAAHFGVGGGAPPSPEDLARLIGEDEDPAHAGGSEENS